MKLMKTNLILHTLVITAALGTASVAHAQVTFFPDNATIASAISGNVSIGYANQTDLDNGLNGTSPTVNLVAGGSVNGFTKAYNSSVFSMSSGSAARIVGYNNSILNISGGTFINVAITNAAVLNLYGSGLSDTPDGFSPSGAVFVLSGVLSDGTDISGLKAYVGSPNAQINFINSPAATPEPGSIALLVGMASVGVGLLRKRRK